MVSEHDVAFASAPTTGRLSIRTVLVVANMFRLPIGSLDVTQAFLQSDTVAFRGRQIVCLPSYVILPKPEDLLTANEKIRQTAPGYFRILPWGERKERGAQSNFPV